VIEETFALACGTGELQAFLLASRKDACGWTRRYDGAPTDELDALERVGKLTPPQAEYRDWQRLFVRLKSELVQTGPR
jgi:hypothetical protein